MSEQPIVTVQQHILQQQQRFPGATGEFSFLLSGITLATKMIQAKVRRAGLSDILGSADEINVQGEVQQKLDVFANHAMMHCLKVRDSVAALVSEENQQPFTFRHDSPEARYAIFFDPLDGSSNIDVNISVGTIFSIVRLPVEKFGGATTEVLLQPGSKQIAAGYVVYGSSTMLVYSVGNGVHGFTLEPSIGAYVLSHENIRMPRQGSYYSTNEAYRRRMPLQYQQYLDKLCEGVNGKRYGSRYIGSLVADFHRTLLKGGVFLYPPTEDQPQGKLRLMYEANPVAFLTEQAGGRATDGRRPILEIQPTDLHQRTPLVVGSQEEMNVFERCAATAEDRVNR